MSVLITLKSLSNGWRFDKTLAKARFPASRKNRFATRHHSRICPTRVYRSIAAISRSHHYSDERELADDQKIFGTDWLLRTRRSD